MTRSINDARQLAFLQSRVNGAPYHGEELPQHKWNWPQGTYLQQRLKLLQETQIARLVCLNRSHQARFELFYRRLLEQF
jgi:hypothetical protein